MGLFEKIKTKYNEHVQARNDACSNLIADINLAIHEKATILSSQESFIDVNAADRWSIKYSDLKKQFPNRVLITKVSTRFYFYVPKGFFITGVVNTRFYFFIKVHLIYCPVFAENSL